jgi:ribonuclease D
VDALKAWRSRAAADLGLDISVVLPGRLVDRVAESQPKAVSDLESIDGLRRWRIRTFGPDLVQTIRRA